MNKFLPTSFVCAASIFTPLAADETPLNVLFITVDDMRPEIPAYGATHIHAPNFERLSDEGLTFSRAYVQQAICQPARANVLTGARPDTTRIYNVFEGGWPTFRTTMGSVATLPSMFKDNGYWTAGFGKNFHHVDNPSWTVHETFYTTADLYQLPENRAIAGNVNERPPWEYFPDALEENTMDWKVADAAVQAIRDRAADETPFFIAAGFWKPHLPFSVPQQYWDLYDRETLPIATGPDALPVAGALPTAFYDAFSGELTTYRGGRPPFVGQTAETQAALANGTFTTNQQTGDDWGIITVNGTHIYPEDYARALTHGYYASISFIDAQIGKIMQALEDEDLLDNTIVVLWGDHGFHLGQHGSWPKHTNMDIATRIPFIIHHPDMPASAQGVMTDALMESVDIMPTLLEMAGLPMPTTHDMEGVSLVPLLDDPHQTWKTAAFSQYPKEVPMNSGIWYMGYAMRTATHTYTQWREMDATDGNPISLAQRNFTVSNRIAYEELYDMVNDPSQNTNIGGDPQYRALMDALSAKVNTAIITGYANTQNVGVTDPAAPVAHAVSFYGGTEVGDTLNVHYIFADPNGDLEDGTTIEWVRDEDFEGSFSEVVGSGETYTLQSGDLNHFVRVRVTPIADAPPTTGATVLSASAIVAGVGFTDGSDLPPPQSAIYEGFDYAAGIISSTSAGGRGWNGGWWGNDGLTFGGNSGSAAADFSWTDLPDGYYHEPIGRAATNGANANNPYRQLASAQTIDLGADGTRYFSFLYRHNGSAPVFEKRFHSGTTEILKLQINATGSLSLITPDETNMNLLTLNADSDYVVLGRIQSVASGNDTLSVSIYKSGDIVPAQAPVFAASINVNSSAVIDRIFMGNPVNSGNTGNSYWDELHIDTNYRAVVGVASEEDPDAFIPPTVVETFEYDAGGINAGNAGGTGWSGGWFGDAALTFSGNSGAAVADKTWSLPDGYHYEPEGRAGTNNNHGNTPFRALGPAGQIDLTSDTTYFSFLFSHDSTSMFEFRFYAGTNEITKLQIDDNGQLRLVGSAFAPTGFNLTSGNDYLILGRIVGNASGDDLIQVNVYPSSGTVPETEPSFAYSTTFESSATIDRIMMGIPGSTATSATYWDELRMGPTWGSVLGAGTDDHENGDDNGGNGDDYDDDEDPLPPPGEPELLLHLAFDDETLADSSSADLSIGGTVGFGSDGERNYAIFNGTSNALTVPMIRSFPEGMTIAFWTLAQDGEDGMPKNTALGYARQADGDGTIIAPGYGNAQNRLFRLGRAGTSHDEVLTPPLTDFLNTWVHWAITKDPASGVMRVYRDGELFDSANDRTIVPAFEEHWSSGGASGGFRIGWLWDQYYKGYLDDYRIYSGVLSEAEIADLYTGSGGELDPDPDPDPVPGFIPPAILHLTFDNGDLSDSSPAGLNVTGSVDFATADGRSYATLNGIDQAITVPILRNFPEGISIAFWTLAQDGENGMPKNTALGWARQGGTTGDIGDGVVLGFGWNNSSNALVRVGRENNTNDDISILEITNWINNWVHWAVVKNPVAGTIEVYRDGQLYSSVTGRNIIPAFESQSWATGAGYRIGRYFDDYYKGYLDDYRMYDAALDAAAIQTIFQQGAATGPTAFNVTISGTPSVGELLTGSYDFIHPDGAEGDSTFQWYRSDTEFGVYTAIDGATELTYTPVAEDDGGFLIFGVTPVGDDTLVGQEALSDPVLIGTFTDRSLQNTLYSLVEDQALNVVFFGGSITDGAGQNNGLPWRTRIENWFTAQFPEVNFTFTNAAISGTSSEFGVFRTDRHVLSAEPDLVFVEFAVNDIEQPSNIRTRQTMEGIVRKIRQSRPTADIVFVYTTTRANAVNFYEQGQLPGRTLVHQEVADHYGIYAIDVAAALVAHKQQTGFPYRIEYGEPGAFDPAADHYLPDHVHPSNLGHQVYGDTVAAALDTLLSITPPANPVPHPVPELLSGYDMTSARIIDHTHPDVTHGDGWTVQAMGIGSGGRTDDFLTTTTASTASDISISFSGTELGVYYRRSTSGGQITWDVDDGAAGETFSFWHETLSSFTSFAMLSTELGEGNHTATVSPGSFEEHETLNIAGWLVMGEFEPGTASYSDWAETVFAHLEGGADHPEAAPDFVPPGTRLNNLQIFAYGGTPDSPPAPPALQSSETHPVLVYTRRIDGAAQPTVFFTTDLTSTWITEGLQETVTPHEDGIRETVHVQSPQPLDAAPVQFMAVQVEVEP
jgi:iduronate 2-sulfatase